MRSVRVEDSPRRTNPVLEALAGDQRETLGENSFRRMIAVERKRSERSKEPFLLLLVELGDEQEPKDNRKVLERMLEALRLCSRETDVIGWYKEHSAIGVMFTGLVVKDKDLIRSTLLSRVSDLLRNELTFDQFDEVRLSFHFFPDAWDHEKDGDGPTNVTLYPDLMNPPAKKKSLLMMKRAIDVVASGLGLLVLSPVFAAIAILIKLTSKGPVLFKQQRVGQYGKLFTVLKFRSMFVNNDHSVHQEYVTKLIANQAQRHGATGAGDGVYKLTNDRRITPLGEFLRRTSLDELPQIFNVLLGEMSLVGPRPAIPYELAAYQTWHRRRILEAKPGITGLWQVTGRSLVKFDDMVRLDLRYANSWSLWLDLWILVRTPMAVIRGSGAY
ncbi:sugar transferase [Occallatibacter riparius]|uniref:Sugar transferase n=1 Tax=Occallatibacter riparius TaxID=1002689 RepID=A0A9J7BZ13_9BACT|nr:sugar transferase [Occallatibacter riparius]UWZ86925.1 sugar transferase [Occallatibacter riparius]